MAVPISRQGYPVVVELQRLGCRALTARQVPVLLSEDFKGDEFLVALPGRSDFTSAGHTHGF
ncbi:hypothetical protein [Streptomyces sp. NBC_00582]|uniref:hypothetical protein n=1 Tax=Streptomyces sp. NBC_00582 TaxID=2975783 RepID=UPI002E8220C7|nr:hypothetical protein [Streptomyces sp. NBC_00582]WUB59059.1 hypothetical protein OG852_00650 [Streptomyces sp. NBC_00582]WUB67669.1 hypothetical protein OG852_48485 [Streptomyces sp. NBC_00582]